MAQDDEFIFEYVKLKFFEIVGNALGQTNKPGQPAQLNPELMFKMMGQISQLSQMNQIGQMKSNIQPQPQTQTQTQTQSQTQIQQTQPNVQLNEIISVLESNVKFIDYVKLLMSNSDIHNILKLQGKLDELHHKIKHNQHLITTFLLKNYKNYSPNNTCTKSSNKINPSYNKNNKVE
jgi:hypothetical protein